MKTNLDMTLNETAIGFGLNKENPDQYRLTIQTADSHDDVTTSLAFLLTTEQKQRLSQFLAQE
jgi:dsDNA-binding SOS-regulon protein